MRLKFVFKKITGKILILSLALTLLLPYPAFSTDPLKKKKEIEDLKTQIAAVQKNIEDTEAEIQVINGRIQGLDKELKDQEKRLAELEKRIKEREQYLRERVKMLYIEDASYSLKMVLDSEGILDFFRRIRFLMYISQSDAETIAMLKKEKAEARELISMIEMNREKNEWYVKSLEEKVAELKNMKKSLDSMLKRAQREYRMMLTPSSLRKVSSRGYIKRGGGYPASVMPPRKYVSVSPYGGGFLTSERMPSNYEASGEKWSCYASWYGNEFHGRRTASGEIFNQWDFTVAHRSLPFGTFVLIRRGDRAIVAKVTDRGPFIPGREFDLSRACAESLGFSGVAKIEVEIIFPK